MRLKEVTNYVRNHFKKQMKSEKGTWVAVAIGGSALVGAGASVYGSSQGNKNQGSSSTSTQYTPAQMDYINNFYPQAQGLSNNLFSTLQNQLQGKGMSPDLENSIWQLANQRNAKAYNNLGNQMGQMAAGRGVLNAGGVMNNWMNQVGLGKAQGEQQIGVERALANYQSMQQAIQNSMGMLGMNPGVSTGSNTTTTGTNTQQQATDYSGLGTLFAKMFSSGNTGAVGTQPGVGSSYTPAGTAGYFGGSLTGL